MARNMAHNTGSSIKIFTTAVFDLVDLGNWRNEEGVVDYTRDSNLKDQRYYFRPLKSILVRTVSDGGKSFYVRGDFTQTIPIFYHSLVNALL